MRLVPFRMVKHIPMHNPRARIVSFKADCYIIGRRSSWIDNVTYDWIIVVVDRAPSTSDYRERMPMKVYRMLYRWIWIHTRCGERRWLTGAPGAPPGMFISITRLGGSAYTEPEGSSVCAVCAPLSICRSTGTEGDSNGTLLTVNSPLVREILYASGNTVMFDVEGNSGPGAAGVTSGCSCVSFKARMLAIWGVTGSITGAPA